MSVVLYINDMLACTTLHSVVITYIENTRQHKTYKMHAQGRKNISKGCNITFIAPRNNMATGYKHVHDIVKGKFYVILCSFIRIRYIHVHVQYCALITQSFSTLHMFMYMYLYMYLYCTCICIHVHVCSLYVYIEIVQVSNVHVHVYTCTCRASIALALFRCNKSATKLGPVI